ncbi:MAG TPA: serine/threonine-protein kinase [Polyangiaceae bacterium]|nr:serine/threonine-protein kinase [Polyangiaceae bacterium]
MTQPTNAQTSSRRAGLRYERLFLLGSGGMASVHLALAVGPSGFNRLVVVKSMRQELSAQSDSHQMFLAEARLSMRLNHPNVVQVSEVAEAPDGIMLVMEYLDGIPLSQVIRVASDAFTLPMRLRTICEVLAGLHYAHELTEYDGSPLSIVHRDVSPQNVFLTFDGRVKLLDFGIAKATTSEQTQAGVVKGRIAYMPAEQLTGDRVDRRTDIYAVGCLLWELIAGSRLWANQTDREILSNVIAGHIPPLSSRVQVDPELEAIVKRATALSPGLRYRDAESMRLDLEQYLSRAAAPVSTRDIGDMLSRISPAAREERQRAIAEAVAKVDVSAPASGEEGLGELASFDRLKTPSTSRGSGTMLSVQLRPSRSGEHRLGHPSAAVSVREISVRDMPPSSRSGPADAGHTPTKNPDTRSSLRVIAARPMPAWSIAVVALVAVVAVVAVVLFFKNRGVPSGDLAAAQSPPAAVAPATRALTIDATPRDARITVDGALVPGNPAVSNVTAGSEHVVRVEREGFQPSERRVQVNANLAMNVSLAAIEREPDTAPPVVSKAEPHATAGRVVRRVARPAASTPKATPSAARDASKDCDPPFYFKGGIKTYKPGCI